MVEFFRSILWGWILWCEFLPLDFGQHRPLHPSVQSPLKRSMHLIASRGTSCTQLENKLLSNLQLTSKLLKHFALPFPSAMLFWQMCFEILVKINIRREGKDVRFRNLSFCILSEGVLSRIVAFEWKRGSSLHHFDKKLKPFFCAQFLNLTYH